MIDNNKESIHKIITPELHGDFETNKYVYGANEIVAYTITPDGMTEYFLKHMNKGLSATWKLAGDIKVEYDVDNFENLEMFKEFKQILMKMLSEFHQKQVIDIAFDNVEENGGYDIWVNEMCAGEFNPLHNHVGVNSFVWYLDIPDEVRQEWSDVGSPRGLIQFVSGRTSGYISMNPQTSDLLLFDSNHLHQVYPFYSDNIRISLAGNVRTIWFEDGSIFKDNNKEN